MNVAGFYRRLNGNGYQARGRSLLRALQRIALVNNFFKARNGKLPVISIFGHDAFELVTPTSEDNEEKRLDCRFYPSDANLEIVLVKDRPHVVISIGILPSFPNLIKAPFEIRKRWLHFEAVPNLAELGIDAYNCYLKNLFTSPGSEGIPLVTVFTAAYKSGERIHRPFRSLKGQTYNNWEWIIVDDSDDRGETLKNLSSLAREDHRIQVFKPWEHSGMIGKVKNWACSLGKGRNTGGTRPR